MDSSLANQYPGLQLYYCNQILGQQIDGETLQSMGQYGTSDNLKECGLVTVRDQTKFKKSLPQLFGTAAMNSTTAADDTHGVKGKRTLAQIKKMTSEEKRLYYAMWVYY